MVASSVFAAFLQVNLQAARRWERQNCTGWQVNIFYAPNVYEI
jgi:hypothetical protein